MTILGVDPGTKSGWGVITDGVPTVWGVLRIKGIPRKAIEEVYTKYSPDVVVIEEPFYTSFGKHLGGAHSYGRLKEIQGYWKILSPAPVVTLPPKRWRKLVYGSAGFTSKEAKKKAKAYLKETYNIEPKIDAAEAILIGLAYLKLSK